MGVRSEWRGRRGAVLKSVSSSLTNKICSSDNGVQRMTCCCVMSQVTTNSTINQVITTAPVRHSANSHNNNDRTTGTLTVKSFREERKKSQ